MVFGADLFLGLPRVLVVVVSGAAAVVLDLDLIAGRDVNSSSWTGAGSCVLLDRDLCGARVTVGAKSSSSTRSWGVVLGLLLGLNGALVAAVVGSSSRRMDSPEVVGEGRDRGRKGALVDGVVGSSSKRTDSLEEKRERGL